MKKEWELAKDIRITITILLALTGLCPYYAPHTDAGWSSMVARRAHNPKVVGSNPAPATKFKADVNYVGFFVCAILRQ